MTDRLRLYRFDGDWYLKHPKAVDDLLLTEKHLESIVTGAKFAAADGDVDSAHLLADYHEAEAARLRLTGVL